MSVITKAVEANVAPEELEYISNMFSSCQTLFRGFESHNSREAQILESGTYIKLQSCHRTRN